MKKEKLDQLLGIKISSSMKETLMGYAGSKKLFSEYVRSVLQAHIDDKEMVNQYPAVKIIPGENHVFHTKRQR